MPRSTCPCAAPPRPDVAWWNEAIRRHTVATTEWTPTALAELARLRAGWRAAVDAEAARDLCAVLPVA